MATPRGLTAVAAAVAGSALVVVALLPVGAQGGTRRDRPSYGVTSAPAPTTASPVGTDRLRHGTTLVIPRLDLRVAVVDGTTDDDLALGVGHWANDTGPGERGNYVLAGHRVTHGQPFADLPELRAGDRVVVETADRDYVYVMDTAGDGYRVDDADLWPVGPRPLPTPLPTPTRGADRVLTLVTCAETFHTDERLVAFGHLESVERISAPSR